MKIDFDFKLLLGFSVLESIPSMDPRSQIWDRSAVCWDLIVSCTRCIRMQLYPLYLLHSVAIQLKWKISLRSQVSWTATSKLGHDTIHAVRIDDTSYEAPSTFSLEGHYFVQIQQRGYIQLRYRSNYTLQPMPMPMPRSLFIFIVAVAGAFASATSVATKNEVVTTVRELETLQGKSSLSRSCMHILPTSHRFFLRARRGSTKAINSVLYFSN